MEGLAGQCQAHGLPVRAICWGLWKDTGMASSTLPPTSFGGPRALPMIPKDALQALEISATTSSQPVIAIADIDWHAEHHHHHYQQQQQLDFLGRISLWKELATFSKKNEGTKQREGDYSNSSNTGISGDNAESLLHVHLCEVLALNPQTNIPDDLLLAELGLDSMGGMEMRASIARATGLWLPLKTFRSPTKASILAAYNKTLMDQAQLPHMVAKGAPEVNNSLPKVRSLTDISESEGPNVRRFKWLDFIGGHKSTATLRLICFNDAGGDPANFGSWLPFLGNLSIELWAIHWPHHTSRSQEPPCDSLVHAADLFMAEVFPFLDEKPYAFFGQCIGAYYALRFTEELRERRRARKNTVSGSFITGEENQLRLPSVILSSACPGPNDLDVLKVLVEKDTLYEGLKSLSLAIGWSEEEWERFSSNKTLYEALVGDVSMADPATLYNATKDPLDMPIVALLGDQDPVVMRTHLYSWMISTTGSFRMEIIANQGHNMQFEPALISKVCDCLVHLKLNLSQNNTNLNQPSSPKSLGDL